MQIKNNFFLHLFCFSKFFQKCCPKTWFFSLNSSKFSENSRILKINSRNFRKKLKVLSTWVGLVCGKMPKKLCIRSSFYLSINFLVLQHPSVKSSVTKSLIFPTSQSHLGIGLNIQLKLKQQFFIRSQSPKMRGNPRMQESFVILIRVLLDFV